MNRTIALSAAASIALAIGGSVLAHHSGLMYQTTAIWVEGTVTRFDNINPHSVTTLEQTDADGEVALWAIEGPPQIRLGRLGGEQAAALIGQRIKVCAFPYRSAEELAEMFPDANFSERVLTNIGDEATARYVAGHVIVTEDGEFRSWEPHGTISECIRISDEPTQLWVDFVNSGAQIRQAWCTQRGYTHVRSSESLMAVVDQIDALIDNPC